MKRVIAESAGGRQVTAIGRRYVRYDMTGRTGHALAGRSLLVLARTPLQRKAECLRCADLETKH